ncbi:hypothetical protein QZN19_24190 [Burkholderia vietnamiensis]|nr:hypothetical protein [Burkholderia vietnamiensis]MDN8069663.1 hypothetical protein [Burkholderia vietnamiensis]
MGHGAGDEVLRAVARRLRRILRCNARGNRGACSTRRRFPFGTL